MKAPRSKEAINGDVMDSRVVESISGAVKLIISGAVGCSRRDNVTVIITYGGARRAKITTKATTSDCLIVVVVSTIKRVSKEAVITPKVAIVAAISSSGAVKITAVGTVQNDSITTTVATIKGLLANYGIKLVAFRKAIIVVRVGRIVSVVV